MVDASSVFFHKPPEHLSFVVFCANMKAAFSCWSELLAPSELVFLREIFDQFLRRSNPMAAYKVHQVVPLRHHLIFEVDLVAHLKNIFLVFLPVLLDILLLQPLLLQQLVLE